MVLEHDVQHGRQDKQQREDRDQGGVRDQRGEVARLVIAEFLPDRDRHGQPRVPLLKLIRGPDGSLRHLCHVHCEEDLPGRSRIHPPESGPHYRRP